MRDALSRLRKLGYEVAPAFGAVEPEEKALDEAGEIAAPKQLAVTAQAAAKQAEQAARGLDLPDEDLFGVVARATAQAVSQLQSVGESRVGFQERALEIARKSPTVYSVTGPGFAVYLALDDDTGEPADNASEELLASLEDRAAHRERVKQADQTA